MQTSPANRSGGLRSALASSPLRHGDFRVLWLATVFQGAGYIGETVVLGWLLLEKTDSAFVVGLGIALRAVPNFLLGIPSGALADRVDRRALIRWVSTLSGLNAGTLAALGMLGMLPVGAILALTLAGGAIRAMGQAARQSYTYDIVGPAQAVSGIALTTLGQRVGGIAGALGIGFIVETAGGGEAYLAVSLSLFLSAGVMLMAKSTGQSAPLFKAPIWQGTRDYFIEMAANRTLGALVALTAAVEIFGFSHQAALPSLARDLLHVGPDELGMLNAAGSGGGIVAIVLLSMRGEPARRGRLFLLVLLAFGAALVLLANSSSFGFALAAIALVSGLAALTDLMSQTLVQAAVPNELRGRAMGSWVLAVGLGPVGHVQIGLLIALSGVTVAVMLNGLALCLLAMATFIGVRRIRYL